MFIGLFVNEGRINQWWPTHDSCVKLIRARKFNNLSKMLWELNEDTDKKKFCP